MGHMTLGIIGGMGPKATSVFYDRFIEATDASKDQEHVDMVILNHATLPDRTSVILEGKAPLFLSEIEKDVRLLEQAGVAHIAIPCNTSHYFYEQIQGMTQIPVLNMIDETLQEIYNVYGAHTKIGLLATNGTVRSGVYAKYSKKYQLNIYEPDEVLQQKVMNIIYTNIKGGFALDATELEAIVQQLVQEHGCSCVIIGCTELSIIPLREEIRRYCFDAMDVLVARAIQKSGKALKCSLPDRVK